MPRIFIAALLPEDIKKEISRIIDNAKPCFKGVKWEKTDKIHITISFIGNADSATTEEVLKRISGIIPESGPISLAYSYIDAFPDFKRPRVLVIRFNHSEELLLLKEKIEEELSLLGINLETRTFKPHITIGRVKKGFVQTGKAVKIDKNVFQINSIAVVKSELRKEGAEYNNLGVYKLS